MLPTIQIGNKTYDVKNIGTIELDTKKIVNNLRHHAKLKLYEIAYMSGVSYTRIQKASIMDHRRFSDCEKIALLDLHYERCRDVHDWL